jgi:hypothetical protein
MKAAIMAAVAMMSLSGVAQAADVLAAGGLFGGPAQKSAVCFVYNGGLANVTITPPRIYGGTGFALPPTSNNCGTTLAPGTICRVQVVADNLPYSCRTTVSPAKTDVRGMFEVRDANGVVLQNIALR